MLHVGAQRSISISNLLQKKSLPLKPNLSHAESKLWLDLLSSL